MPALKPRLQITLTGVAVGLQKPLVTDLHRNYWGPKPPQEGLYLSGDQIISARDLSCQWEEKLFPSGELSGTQNIPCQLLVLPAGPGQRIRKALNWSEVLLCPSIEPGLMLLQLPTFPERVEDLAGRVWRLWRRSSFILGLGGGTQAPVWCPGTPGSSWELQYAAIHIPN